MLRIAFVPSLLLVFVVACDQPAPPKPPVPKKPVAAPRPASTKIDPLKLLIFQPIPDEAAGAPQPVTAEKVALGKQLYADARLSKSGKTSCSTCHSLDQAGTDGRALPEVAKGAKALRHTPTTLNAALSFAQGWDGRAETVEAFVKLHLADPSVMGGAAEKAVSGALKKDDAAAFAAAFPAEKGAISSDTISAALGAYLRKLLTPGRWDKFLGGDESALTEDEKKGVLKFVETGCTACHMGAPLGGMSFQKFGLVSQWPNLTEDGRALVTKAPEDKGLLKVPTLRNVARTAPYMHDGSVPTLEEAIKLMAHHQFGKELPDADVKSIAAFLHALDGEIPAGLK